MTVTKRITMKHQEYIDIAYGCITLWNQNKYREAYEKYYADNAQKVEPVAWGAAHANEVAGAENMADHEEWLTEEWLDINSVSVAEGPFIGATGFSVIIKSDFTMKKSGERHIFREVGYFTVENGKIVREEYLYDEAELAQVLQLNESS